MKPIDENTNPWQTISDTIAYENNWIAVHHREVITPGGNPGIYGLVHFKNLAIGIIPLTEDGCTWVVGQYRYPLKSYSWEIPEGGGKLAVAPLESAKRELLEECGLEASDWELILEMDLSNSATDERALIYVAKGLTQKEAEPEDTEQLQLRKIPFSELFERVMQGEIRDAMTIAGVLKLQHLMQEKKA